LSVKSASDLPRSSDALSLSVTVAFFNLGRRPPAAFSTEISYSSTPINPCSSETVFIPNYCFQPLYSPHKFYSTNSLGLPRFPSLIVTVLFSSLSDRMSYTSNCYFLRISKFFKKALEPLLSRLSRFRLRT
jgi:hypothetical protein